MRLRLAAAALAATFSLSACAYGGYPGVSVGYGNYGAYGSGYYDPYGYSPYGYNNVGYGGYGSQYGWYDGYYYPGTGYYVYDQYRRPHAWNQRQRQYWSNHHRRTPALRVKNATAAPNWTGFSRNSQIRTDQRAQVRSDQRAQVRSEQRAKLRVDRRSQARSSDENRDERRRRDRD